MQRLGVLTLMLLSTQTASATVIVPPWQCGMQNDASVDSKDVPLNASILVGTSSPDQAFSLRGDMRVLPMTRIAPNVVEVKVAPLIPHMTYTLESTWGRSPDYSFSTGETVDTMPPNAPRVVWDDYEYPHVVLLPDEDPDEVVAVLVTALGPRARYTYLARMGTKGTSVLAVTNPECLARAGISTDEPVCFELVVVDRAGNRSPPTFTCHDIRLPVHANDPRAIVNGLQISRRHMPKPPPPDPEWPWRRFAGIVFALAIASLVWWRWSATRSDR